ncbi:MAG: hypothetical protein V2J24_01360 [Pseudomonadales bacterium]|jgi:hypothetical protein|nr:hypothetical protein [Pseudomonadales bacterium]
MVFALVLAAGSIGVAEEGGPASASGVAISTPRELALQIPARLGTALFREPVEVVEAGAVERRRAASGWIAEVYAPLATDACVALLGEAPPDTSYWAAFYPEGDPATPSGGVSRMLVPADLPLMDARDTEVLHAKGMLPLEIMMAGEWARAVGQGHAGPPLADPLLRQARAARLEGVARLAGLAVGLASGGVDPADLGAALVDADADDAGWPRGALAKGARSSLDAALLRVFTEDGLRWATFHYLRGGMEALLEALEIPPRSPLELLRPGYRAELVQLEGEGCRIGPRPSAALLVENSDPSWVDAMLADLWQGSMAEKARVELVFDRESAAGSAERDLIGRGWRVSREGARLEAERSTPLHSR